MAPLGTIRPDDLARNLSQLADRLRDEGDKALQRAAVYASRGLPSNTNGSDGGRSSDQTSSTERAALNPGPFDNIDLRLNAQLGNLWAGIVLLHASLDLVMAHASDEDPVPPGTGRCAVEGCDHVCNPRKNPHDRLKGGYCPRHWMRWLRLGRPDRGWYERTIDAGEVA